MGVLILGVMNDSVISYITYTYVLAITCLLVCTYSTHYFNKTTRKELTLRKYLKRGFWNIPKRDVCYDTLDIINVQDLSLTNIAIIGPTKTGKTVLKKYIIKTCATKFDTPYESDINELYAASYSQHGCIYECTGIELLGNIYFDYLIISANLVIDNAPEHDAWIVLNRFGGIHRFPCSY